MHPVAITYGPIQVYSFSLALMVALVLCALVAWRLLPMRGVSSYEATNLAAIAGIAGVAGARAAYVIAHWQSFSATPLDVLRLDKGGLVFYGGVAGAAIGLWAYATIKKMPRRAVADIAVVALPLGAAIGRMGCFMNGCCEGLPTDVAWAITFPGQAVAVHPTQLYDATYNIILFGIVLALFIRRRLPDGALFWLFFVLYGIARAVVESFREQSVYVAGLSGAQLISAILVPVAVTALVIMIRSDRAKEVEE